MNDVIAHENYLHPYNPSVFQRLV